MPVRLVALHLAVIVAQRESGGREFVDDDRDVRMQLQRRRRHHGGQRSFTMRATASFGGSVSNQQAMPRFQDGSNSHGDHVERDVVAAESGPVGFTGEAGQRLDARPGRERRRGLIESEVAIPANPQELQVYSPGGADVALELLTPSQPDRLPRWAAGGRAGGQHSRGLESALP